MLPGPRILFLQMVRHSGFVRATRGEPPSPCANSPSLFSLSRFRFTLRCAEVLFSSVLTPLATEVVSVVGKVLQRVRGQLPLYHTRMQMLSLQYKLLSRAGLLPESSLPPGSADEPDAHRRSSSHPPRPGFDGHDNTKVLHTGGWALAFCGSLS